MTANHESTKTEAAAQSFVQISSFGGPENIEVVREQAVPQPGPGEALIEVEASSVQFTDTTIRKGVYPDVKGPLPVTLGYDLVGKVVALGAGVTNLAVGERVADLCVTGGNARYALRPASGLVPVPEAVDAAEAATLVLSWLTAYQCLHRAGKIREGSKVLVIGGNGAVGQAVITLAKQAGALPFATASSKHHENLKRLGATPLPRDGWLPEVEKQMDLVIDGVCADGFVSSRKALGSGGKLVAIGLAALFAREASTLTVIWCALKAAFLYKLVPDGRGSTFYSITGMRKKHPDWFREDLGSLLQALAESKLKPVVAERIALTDVARVHTELESGGGVGKRVLVF